MAFITDIKDFQLVTDLVSSTVTPTQNDKVFIKEKNSLYDYDPNSTLTPDNDRVIHQTAFSGRWIQISVEVERTDDVVLRVGLGTNPHTSHFYGEPEINIGFEDDKREVLVQVNEKYLGFINDLYAKGLDPKICLLREPMNGVGRKATHDKGKRWTHPTHQNTAIAGQKQSSGIQFGSFGSAMNHIDTEWAAPTDKNHVSIMIRPIDWYRIAGNTFGSAIMPILHKDWHEGNKVRIRGRKSGMYHGRKKAIRFKFCLEWSNPKDLKVRLRSQPSVETVTLMPIAGIFGVGGQYPDTTKEFNRWFYSWKLTLR